MKIVDGVRITYGVIQLVVFSLLYVAVSVPVFAGQLTLTVFNYPPYMDESVPSKGLYCELVEEAYKASGYEVSFQFYPLARSTNKVLSGQALGQLGTEWNFPVEARTQDLISVPLFYYRVVGFYLKSRFGNVNFSSLSDLRGYNIDVIRGSSDAYILKSRDGLKVEEVTTGEQVIKKIYAHRGDIGFMVELTGLSIIARLYPDEQEQWVMTEDAIQGILAQVVFSRKYPEVEKYVEALKQGVKTIRDNGIYNKILEKYYGQGRVPEIVSDLNQSLYIIPKD